MKKVLITILCSFLLTVLSACSGNNGGSTADDPTSESYDWVKARRGFINELHAVLDITIAGTSSDFKLAEAEWSARSVPVAHTVMFSEIPPENCSSSITYGGYSAPEFNSSSAEYLTFMVRRMNNDTLASGDWRVTIRIERGNDGYYISEYIREAVQ